MATEKSLKLKEDAHKAAVLAQLEEIKEVMDELKALLQEVKRGKSK